MSTMLYAMPIAEYHHWAGPWLLLVPLFWLALIFFAVVLLRRTVLRRHCAPFGDSPLAVLGRRYAQGEIDADEYRARRAVLTEQHEGRGKQPKP
ncbi:SHOCT domain-containing protein [Kitasatospora sp. GP82]|uniref:SHOCT domain-containing protein n=1 Tax=Kitasatospora sp. GP82 TaxID=3035089 RepID=UPI00247533C7|nr:SHOCT domain-containing protein [Kitasatospora sp. GP82]MDH6128194.1 putative membrane protein [Kitasatospora sp. GP82]